MKFRDSGVTARETAQQMTPKPRTEAAISDSLLAPGLFLSVRWEDYAR